MLLFLSLLLRAMNLFEDTYTTIENPVTGLFKDKGSKFIAYAFPFNNEHELKDLLIKVKTEHPKARHHCYAYRLGIDRSVFRVNDDGEPAGSAGRPILNTLLSAELTNILVVVVRYFGGTLLGIPGLINAYKSATQDAIDQASKIEKHEEDVYEIQFDYPQMNDIMRLVKDENLDVIKQNFEITCLMHIAIRKTMVNRLADQIVSLPNTKLKYLRTV